MIFFHPTDINPLLFRNLLIYALPPLSVVIVLSPHFPPAVPVRYLSGHPSTRPPFPHHFHTALPIQYKSTGKWSAELRIQLLTSFRDAGFQVN